MTDSNAAPLVGIEFTETMRGDLSLLPSTQCAAPDQGEPILGRLEFTVTILVHDLDRFVRDKRHAAALTGSVTAPRLSPAPLRVTQGTFNLFVTDETEVATRKMLYQMELLSTEGDTYQLVGEKTLRNDAGLDSLADTTTLRYSIRRGTSPGEPIIGTGVVRIGASDLRRQLTTLRAINAENTAQELAAIARFGGLFAGMLYDVYGGIAARFSLFDPAAPPRRKRELKISVAPEIHDVVTEDGVTIRLTRYRAGSKGPVLCIHGLGVSSRIFSTDLIDQNLVEALAAADYDIWLLDYRCSIELPVATRMFTADEVVAYDLPAAVKYVRTTAQVETIQCLVHCFGANAFFMAMLGGLEGVRAAAVSQIATHLRVPFATALKARLRIADLLYVLGVNAMTAYTDRNTSIWGRMLNALLRLYPVHDGPRDVSAVSRRISFLYGQLYELDQLNQRTYANLHELFGVAGTGYLRHLSTMVRHGHVVNATGADVYLQSKSGMQALKRLAIPMAIAHGERNKCWLPASTEVTVKLLREANGANLYERKVFQGYGHIDCIFGKNAARDVYPFFIQHLDKSA